MQSQEKFLNISDILEEERAIDRFLILRREQLRKKKPRAVWLRMYILSIVSI